MNRSRFSRNGTSRQLLAKDHGRLSALDSSYSYLRQFTPGVLAAADFTGGQGTADLMAAVVILKNLNASGGRKVPAGAPASFVPARYADYWRRRARPVTAPASGITGSWCRNRPGHHPLDYGRVAGPPRADRSGGAG